MCKDIQGILNSTHGLTAMGSVWQLEKDGVMGSLPHCVQLAEAARPH